MLNERLMSLKSCVCVQVSLAAGEWSDHRMHCRTVLQGQIQTGAAIPTSTMFTSWSGAEAHLSSSRGQSRPFFFLLAVFLVSLSERYCTFSSRSVI